MVRYNRRLHPPLIDATIIVDKDKFIFRVASSRRQIRDLCDTTTCDAPAIPFPYVNIQNLSTVGLPMINNSFLWWLQNDLFSRLRRVVAHRLVSDYNERSCTVTRHNDPQLMLMYSRLRRLMPDMVNPVSREYDIVQLSIRGGDYCDSDYESVPARMERHLVDSDSDSSMEYRRLAHRYGWYEGSSESSDNSSVPSLDYGSEDDDTRDLVPVG